MNGRNIKILIRQRLVCKKTVVLFAYFAIVLSCSCKEENNYTDKKTPLPTELSQAVLDYYSTQSTITHPGAERYLYDDLPENIEDIVAVLQGLVIHIGNFEGYHLEPSEEQDKGYGILRCEDLLRRIRQIDDRPFTIKRDRKHRLVVICREFAVLMCSMLRYKDIPARVRTGYATYLTRGKYVQHFICEYWNCEKQRWVQVDPDYNPKNRFSIGFDPLDIPRGRFMTAGEGWKLCRSGQTDLKLYGLGEEGMGWDIILPNLITDLMALNKLELRPWDKSTLGEKDYQYLTNEELALMDRIADYTINVDENFQKMRDLYDASPALQKAG